MSRWNILSWMEREVIERDRYCIYCHVPLGAGAGNRSLASWEHKHIVNGAKIVTRTNIAPCYRSCNSSKGAKPLVEWLESAYCKRLRITTDTVADIVNHALGSTLNSRASDTT